MKILLYHLLFIFCITNAWAQEKNIEVKLLQYSTHEAIEGAVITYNIKNSILTNSSGTAQLPAGVKKITVSAIGFKTVEHEIAGDNITILMEKTPLDLSEITIKGNQPFKSISKIDLNTRPVRSTQDLLRIVPGLFISQHQGGGKAEQIFLRGFDIDHGTDISISVDGIPVNMVSHAHGQGYADLHFVIPELVQKVDFGTGPYYTGQGNFNTAGYVNFETLSALEKNRVQLEAGQFNTARLLVMAAFPTKNNVRMNGYLAGEFLYSDGPFISKQHFNRLNITAKYNLKLSNNTTLNFMASAFNSRWDASGQVPERAVEDGSIDRFGAIDDKEGGNTSRYNASIKFNTNGLSQQLYYTKYNFNLFSNFTFFLNDPVNGDQIKQKEYRDIFGYTAIKTITKYIGQKRLFTTAGAGFRYDKTRNSELSHTLNKSILLQMLQFGNINETNLFAYADEKMSFGKWQIDAGIRGDFFMHKYSDKLNPSLPKQNAFILSPKLSVHYSLTDKVQVYAKLGKGFHSNDTRVAVLKESRKILPAAFGQDLGFTLKPFSRLFLNAAFWYLNQEQEFVYVGDEGIVELSGKTQRRGVDINLRYQFNKNLFVDISYNAAKARSVEQKKGEDFIPLAPTLTSVGGITYKSNMGLNGSIRYRYMKNRAANEDNTVIAKGYFIADAAINYTKPKYEIGLVLENLFNTKWNEAQFNTTSRLKNETLPVTELHFTPGTPFFAKLKMALFF